MPEQVSEGQQTGKPHRLGGLGRLSGRVRVGGASGLRRARGPGLVSALGRIVGRVKPLRSRAVRARTWAILTAAIAVMVVAGGVLAGTVRTSPGHAAGSSPGGHASAVPQASAATAQGGGHGAIAPVAAAGSSCTSVAHLGDSTSEGMVSASYLPRRSQRLRAQFRRVGATTEHLDITGATSIVETLPGQANAHQVAARLVRHGFRGCWVLALGTNDTADVVVGSSVGRMARVERMMSVAAGDPVLWVNVVSLRSSGPYAESHMKQWDATLLRACPRYPNMRVFDWASVAKYRWFISDGIHYTSAGYRARARLIANALARAFPRSAQGHPASCVVR